VLTTANSTKIGENIVTDLNANVTLADPKAGQRVLSPEAVLLFSKSVVAKPLMTPEVCSVHIKNSAYQYRWVNFAGRNGQMYMQRKAQGFTNANEDDAQVLGGDVVSAGGEIRAGDLILMKIQRERYDAAIKFNMEKALALQRARGMYMSGASSDVMSDAVPKRESIANQPFTQSGKAQNFIPDNPDALVESSILRGDAEAARAQTDEVRAHAQKAKAAAAAKEE
jgi:hypothetical protein